MTGNRVAMLAALAVLALSFLTLSAAAPPEVEKVPRHVAEVQVLLGDLKVDEPRSYKHMLVFPIRYLGEQPPGAWMTLDEAVAAGVLVIREKEQATVPQVEVENTGEKTIFLMSGEIVRGGRQTRLVKQDTIIEPKQKVDLPVFCVERHRWTGERSFKNSRNIAPASIQMRLKEGAGQAQVWDAVSDTSRMMDVASPTDSLDEVLDSDQVQKEYKALHKALGSFSPDDTVGIAVADLRGGVIGLELFGRRDLFEALQDKLIEGYATDLVLGAPDPREVVTRLGKVDVEAFIRRALEDGSSKYEDTPGSGRGIDLVSGTLRGKGVALGAHAIHLSIQDLRAPVTPARPLVDLQRPGAIR